MNVNATQIQGRLTADPVYDKTVKGSAVCKFGIAYNDYIKQGDNVKNETSFFDVVVFGKEAEYCQNRCLSKGQDLLIVGKLKQNRWESNGQKRSAVQIIAFTVLVVQHEEKGTKDNSDEYSGDSWGWEG